MARSFNGTSDNLAFSGAPVTAAPLTIACWFNLAGALAQELISISDGTTSNLFELRLANVGHFQAGTAGGGSIAVAQVATAPSTGAWHHGAGVFASATSRAAYVDGGGKGTSATNRTPVSPNVTRLGTGPSGSFYGGRLAEVAIWNVALTDAEIAALATGIAPNEFRPQNLVAYWPLYGLNSPDVDYSGNKQNLVVTGTTHANHAPVTIFSRMGPGGLFLPAGTITTPAGTVDVTVQVAAPTVTLTPVTAAAGSAIVNASVIAPAVSLGPLSMAPGAATVTVADISPAIGLGPVVAAAGVANAAVQAAAPSIVLGSVSQQPGVAVVTLDVAAPSVSGQTTVSAGVASVIVVIVSPAVTLGPLSISCGHADVSAAVIAPAIALGPVTLQPGAAQINVTVVAPTQGPPIDVTAGVGLVTIDASGPAVTFPAASPTIEIWQPRARPTLWTLNV